MTLPPLSAPRLRLVFDPADDVAHHRALLAMHDMSAGRVVCQLKAGPQANTLFAAAVLEGLGKDLDRRGSHAGSALNWQRCAHWLRAEGVSDLFALRAQHLDWRGIECMVHLAAEADCGLTLVISGRSGLDARRERATAAFPFQRLDFREWQASHGSRPKPSALGEPETEHDGSLPPVPHDDFTLFRAACRRCLSGADFAVVDECWRAAFTNANAWAVAAGHLDEVGVAEFLRTQIRSARSYGEVVTKLRGAQAAFFRQSWLVKVNHERLAASALQGPYDLLTPATATLLRVFVAPRFAAAATLSLVLRETPEGLVELRVCDLADDGTFARLRGQEVPVPSAFRLFLVALRLERAAQGATGSSPLFISTAAKLRNQNIQMGARTLMATLRLVARETGVLGTTDFTSVRKHMNAVHWAERYGVSVAAIPEARVGPARRTTA